jgi:hypothetical protein
MNKTAIKERVLNLKAQIGIIMKAISERPDFDIDEVNWRKVRTTAKKTRRAIYQKSYGKK